MKSHTAILVLVLCMLVGGCSIANVASRGEYIDQQSIPVGMERAAVLARFGAPVQTKTIDQGKMDLFSVNQGEREGSQGAKVAGLVVADILTLGLAEAVATPATSGETKVIFQVYYNQEETVQNVVFISGTD